ncbi:hypothetical protein [Desulforamulus ferrireducens]|uniref:hypothetical protein n=1 Tax=Desulforamulus ferrireducens TaxID=1833852 RepID=UPI001475EDBC|nr:hypothetical protein [Desulforamulus ferrireducens]
MKKFDWRIYASGAGFLLIGLSMFFPEQTWLIIVGALFFALGMIRKPKKRRG